MSAYLMGRVFYTDLPGHLKLTLLALADHAQDDGTGVVVGQARLARKVGADPRSVRRHVLALREQGWIEKLGRVGPRGQDRHRIVVEKLPTAEQIALPRPDTNVRPDKVSDRTSAASRPDTRVLVDRQHVSDNASVEPSVEPTLAAPRRDELFEVLAEVCSVDRSSLTPSARGELNRAVKELRGVGATPEQIRTRAVSYRGRFAGADLTPSALAKHWPRLGGNGQARPMNRHEANEMWNEMADALERGDL